MHPFFHRLFQRGALWILPLAALAAVLPAGSARAQSGVDMLLKSWDWAGKQDADLAAGGGQTDTHERNSPGDASATIRYSFFQGRVHTQDMPFMVGWSAKFTGFSSANRPAVPQQMHDVAASFATSLTPNAPVEAFGRDWNLALEAGVGHASTDWSDSQGYYGTATLTAGTDLSEDSRFLVGVGYDGNRSVWQDIPLPGFEYRQTIVGEGRDRKKPLLFWRAGFPWLEAAWRPNDDWLVDLNADITAPSAATALVEYEWAGDRRWHAFAQYRTYRTRVHQDGDDGRHRLFFSSDTAELGIRFSPRAGMSLIGAVGYAMNQQLERGWSSSNLQTVREFADAPTIRGEFRWEF